MPPPSEDELRRVYRAHVSAVYAFFAYSVSKETAEDLTSTTFERVLKAYERFDPNRASERTWILTIARNALTDHYRRQAHRQAVSTDEHPLLLDRLVETDDPLARQLRVDGITGWLRELSEREQEILALRYGADMPARDVAELTGLSEQNVHQISSRALRRLRARAESQPVTDSE